MPRGPIEPVLDRLDPLLKNPIKLNTREFSDLVEFVANGLLDKRAGKENLCGTGARQGAERPASIAV